MMKTTKSYIYRRKNHTRKKDIKHQKLSPVTVIIVVDQSLLKPAYAHSLPITASEKGDLLKLCSTGAIKNNFIHFMRICHQQVTSATVSQSQIVLKIYQLSKMLEITIDNILTVKL